MLRPAGRATRWQQEAVRAIRRRELFRVAASDLLGDHEVLSVGAALADLASATIDATLAVAREASGGELVPRIAVIAMGRWGGREMSYASDADAMFVMDDGGDPDSDLVKIAAAVVTEMRALPTRPAADPSLSIDTDLRPEGKGGALIRSLSAYRNYYSRWSSMGVAGPGSRRGASSDKELGQSLMAEIDAHRWPEGGLTTSQLTEIRKLKARVEAERLPRGANPAKHTKLGPGGIADVEWTVQLLQLQHAYELPALRSSQTIVALRAARDAGIIDAMDAGHLESAWMLASRSGTRSCQCGAAARIRCQATTGASQPGRAAWIRARESLTSLLTTVGSRDEPGPSWRECSGVRS